MNKKKIFKKFVRGDHLKKITEWGLTQLFNRGPIIFPYIKTFYQKKTSDRSGKNPNLLFKPSDYESQDILERRKMAFEDAKNHKNFYSALIKKGVYPQGTKVKIKKIKSSEIYQLEFKMPSVKPLSRYLSKLKANSSPGDIDEIKEVGYEVKTIQQIIESEAISRGYKFRELNTQNRKKDNFQTFHEDVSGSRNYGIDSKGIVRYIDLEILIGKLPFKRRNNTELEVFYNKFKKENKLENIISIFLVFGLLSLLSYLLIGGQSKLITANVISNMNYMFNNRLIANSIILISILTFIFLIIIKLKKRGNLYV